MESVIRRRSRSGPSRSVSVVSFLCWICVCFFILSALVVDSENSKRSNANSGIASSRKIATQAQGGGGSGEGAGSSPPRCSAKCGDCTPCRPVHVSVPPGKTPVTTEYYPEAWRCKCGDKLYMP